MWTRLVLISHAGGIEYELCCCHTYLLIAGYSLLVGTDAWGFCVSSGSVWSLYR